MTKPDSIRYPGAIPTQISGPEWIEPDPAVTAEVLEFRSPQDLPADHALDLRLREILQQARLATAASGAVIALARGGKMVCRATLGDKSPSVGVCLNTRSGLSGACAQTRDMQLCDDTLADPRVNVVACRDLGIRSIAVLPVLDGGELWGVLEVFSSIPRSFSESDLQTLQSLSRKISYTVRDALQEGSPGRLPEAFSQPPEPNAGEAEGLEAAALPQLDQPEITVVGRDYRTGALTAAVLALAVLLGWMVGRVGWSMAVNRAPVAIPMSEQEAQAVAQVVPAPTPQPAPPTREESVAPAKPVSVEAKKVPPIARPKAETAEPIGGLVVYEHGKVVFRMAPSPRELPPASAEPAVIGSGSIQKAVAREDDSSAAPASVSPSAAGGLVERVEPEYPEAARQQGIQGPVVLNALVGTDGAVRQLKVISGDPRLAKSATAAVRQWRFKPHLLRGKAVEFENRITVNFALPQ